MSQVEEPKVVITKADFVEETFLVMLNLIKKYYKPIYWREWYGCKECITALNKIGDFDYTEKCTKKDYLKIRRGVKEAVNSIMKGSTAYEISIKIICKFSGNKPTKKENEGQERLEIVHNDFFGYPQNSSEYEEYCEEEYNKYLEEHIKKTPEQIEKESLLYAKFAFSPLEEEN